MVIDGGDGPSRKGGKAPTRRGPRMEEPHTVIRLPEDPYAAGVPRRGGRGRGVLALGVLTVVVAAVIALSSGHKKAGDQAAIAGVGGGVPEQSSSIPARASTATLPAAQPYTDTNFPGTELNGVLIGYPDTKEGAEAAALNFVAAYGSEAMLNTQARHKLIQTIADPAIVSGLQTQLDQAMAIVQSGLGLDTNGNAPAGETAVTRDFPLGVSAVSYSKTKATISVWTTSIAGTAGVNATHPVQETWSTDNVNLTWVNGDWKWSSFTQTEGPVPFSTQTGSSSDDLQKAAQQFARLRYAP